MTFRPRRRKAYLFWKNDRPYYRRTIPAKYRPLYDDKTVWLIPLNGHGQAALEAEAAAHAHRHNEEIKEHEDLGPEALADFIEVVSAHKENPETFPPDGGTPQFWKDGKAHDGPWSVINDPAERRRDAAKGYLAMTDAEAVARLKLADVKNTPPADPELTELRTFKAESDVFDAVRRSGETVLSIMPRWRAHRKQTHATWKKHVQYVDEFSSLHHKPALFEVTKRHVVEYVEYAQTLRYRGKPLAPTAIAKRLDSIRALLAYAVSVDEIDANPATGVQAPKDHRPKTSRSWKSFEHEEIQKLITASTDLWTNRRNSRQPGRREDLMTALQVLIWSGGRPEEICQLRREDVDLVRGVIMITNDESADDARARLTKNEHSIRQVPIHSRLSAALTNHLRSHDSPLLFPSFEPVPTQDELEEAGETGNPVEIKGRYARPLSREWTDSLRELIAKDEPRKVLYSLRHSWAAESRRTGMPEHVRNAIMGHADDNPHAGRYGMDADWLEEKRRHVENMVCV